MPGIVDHNSHSSEFIKSDGESTSNILGNCDIEFHSQGLVGGGAFERERLGSMGSGSSEISSIEHLLSQTSTQTGGGSGNEEYARHDRRAISQWTILKDLWDDWNYKSFG